MASKSLGVLTLDLVMRLGGFKQGADQATRQFDKFQKDINRTASNLSSGLRNIGGAILGGIGIASVIQATSEAEKALAKLDAAVKNNGGAAGRTTSELEAMSGALQSMSTYADDAIQGAQSLLLRFNSISGENFDRATQAVLDLSSALDKDLSTTALALGRALEDPERGLTKLARSGVIFSEAQERVVKGFVDAGQQAQAQSFILDELEKKFGGAAEAARNNFGGALTGLKNAFGDLLEAKGGLPETVAKIEELTKLLSSDRAKRSADVFASSIVNALGAIAAAFAPIIDLFARTINAAGDLGARMDRALFGRTFDDATEKRLFSLTAQLEELKERRDELLQDKASGRERLGLTDASLVQIEREIARVQGQYGRGPTARPRVRRAGGASDITVISEEDASDAAAVLESTRTAAEKYADEVERLDQLLAKKAINQTTYDRAIAAEREKLNKGSAGTKSAASETDTARRKIEDTIAALQTQAATFGLSEQAAFEYSVTQGELARSLDKLGAAAGPVREKLLELSQQKSTREATAAVEEQIASLNEQTATLGLTEEQAFQYSIAQGELSKQLLATGAAGDEMRARLEAAYAGFAEKQRQLAQEAEGQSVFEATRTEAEQYATKLEQLGQLLEDEAVTQDTYNRAVSDAVLTYVDGEDAAAAYAARIAELNRLLAEGTINQAGFEAAVANAEEVFEEAGREAAKVFVDEAKRNTQDILADFLTDPFEKGLDGLVEDFAKTFQRIAAQAVAARIADSLFNGIDAWLDKLFDAFSQIGSLSGSGSGQLLQQFMSFGSQLIGGSSSMGGLEEIVVSAKMIPGYAQGGYTGEAPSNRIAGVVHGREYVMPRERVEEPGARAFLEAFHSRGMRALLERRIDRETRSDVRTDESSTSRVARIIDQFARRSESDVTTRLEERGTVTSIIDRLLSRDVDHASRSITEREETQALVRRMAEVFTARELRMFGVPGFSSGGYTGDAPATAIAGVVHGGEYVIPKTRVEEPGALEFLRAFHAEGMASVRGYMLGGLVSEPNSVAISRTTRALGPASVAAAPSPMNVSQQFVINSQTGTVSRYTQQQVAAAAAKGLAQANRRNN